MRLRRVEWREPAFIKLAPTVEWMWSGVQNFHFDMGFTSCGVFYIDCPRIFGMHQSLSFGSEQSFDRAVGKRMGLQIFCTEFPLKYDERCRCG